MRKLLGWKGLKVFPLLVLVAVQQVRWNEGDSQLANDFTFFT